MENIFKVGRYNVYIETGFIPSGKEFAMLRGRLKLADKNCGSFQMQFFGNFCVAKVLKVTYKRMGQISFRKTAITTCIICAAMIYSINTFAQDTIHVNRVKMVDRVGINRNTGKVIRTSHAFYVKVKTGYIIKQENGIYLVNGREVYPSYFREEKLKNQK